METILQNQSEKENTSIQACGIQVNNMETDPDKKGKRYRATNELQSKARRTTFESNKTKTYLLLCERYTLSMQGQIKQQNDFKNKIYNNPI